MTELDSSMFGGTVVDLSFVEHEFRSGGNVIKIYTRFVLLTRWC